MNASGTQQLAQRYFDMHTAGAGVQTTNLPIMTEDQLRKGQALRDHLLYV